MKANPPTSMSDAMKLLGQALDLRHAKPKLVTDGPCKEVIHKFDATPTRCEPWPAHQGPALAGINAFGFGGTNAHVVVQGAPPRADREAGRARDRDAGARRAWLVPVSARGPEALRATSS